MPRSWLLISILFALGTLSTALIPSPAVEATSTPIPTGIATPTPVPAAAAAVSAAVARMTKYGMEDPSRVAVTAITPQVWNDDCLDLPSGLPCHAQTTPGYAIELLKSGSRYVIRTDAEGKIVRMASAPRETISDAFLEWQINDGKECRTEIVGTERLRFGFCGEALVTEPAQQATMWANLGRESQGEYWKRTYAPFATNILGSTMVFTGTGSAIPTAAEQRAIAEWARERWDEHQSSYLNAVHNLELGWSEKNSTFCGGLWIYRTGLAVAWNCEGSAAVATRFVSGKQLEQFYAWLDSDKRWLLNPNETVPGVPPNTSLGFLWDNPTRTATTQDTQEMLRFLHEVYSSLTSTASATGKVIAGYGAHGTIAGLPLWVGNESSGSASAYTDANGEFSLQNLPVGLSDVTGNHLRFQVPITSTNSKINLGILKYPLIHPPSYYWWAPAPLAGLSDLLQQAQPITFTVCQTDSTWTRPSESVQRERVWSKRPFVDKGEEFLKQWFQKPAVIYDTMDYFEQSFPDGPNLDALASDWRYLTGMWTGDSLTRSQCSYDANALEGLLNRQEIEVWLMGYRATDVRRLGMYYSVVYNRPITLGHPDFLKLDQPSEHFAITVTPAPGFQIIRFPAGSDALAVHLIKNGQELMSLPN